MVRRLGFGALFGLGGYVIAACAGYFLVGAMSSNTHDRSVEAAMTSVFVLGPFGGLIGFIAGFVRGGRAVPPAADAANPSP